MKLDGQWVLTVMKSPAGEICHQYISVVTAIIPYSRTVKLQDTLLGITESVCGLPDSQA